MDMEFIKSVVTNRSINATVHAVNRMHERNLLIDNVIEAIMNGTIIEEYYEDYPFPSCLIFGSFEERKIHIVCSYSDPVHIITVYEPNLNEWEDDFKTRRKV